MRWAWPAPFEPLSRVRCPIRGLSRLRAYGRQPPGAVPHERDVVKGDAKIACIAAASIMAKVTRDEMMVEYDAEYPEYHLAESKGYASPEHIEAIRKHGLSPLHRVSFCGNFLQTERLF